MRSNYWDWWRGVGIGCVVLIHVLASNAHFYSENVNALLLGQILFTCVPIFLALAGFFSAKQISSSYAFYKSRAVRILPPYLMWTLIYILIFKPGHLSSLGSMFKDIVFGEGVVIGYFVVVLLQYILLTPLILKVKNDLTHFVVISLFTLLGIVYLYVVREHYPQSNISKFPLILIPFFVWYPFYHLGLYAAKKELQYNSFLTKHRYILLGILITWCAIALSATWYLRIQDAVNIQHIQFRITVIITSILLFFLALAFYQRFSTMPESSITWLGKHSYAIFLMHILILDLLKPYFSSSLLGSISIAFFINWLIVISITSLLTFALGRLIPARFSNLLIGR